MSLSAKLPTPLEVALNLPEYEVPRLVFLARHIVERMTGNAWFPAPLPSLATVALALADLADAETAVASRKRGAVATRDEKRRVLVSRLRSLKGYVQGIADANRDAAGSIIESAGMSVKRKGVRAVRVFAANSGRVSGSVDLVAPRAGDRGSYEWAHSPDGGITWVVFAVTNKASATATDLKPGSRAHFRYRVTVKSVTGDWSDPVTIIVV